MSESGLQIFRDQESMHNMLMSTRIKDISPVGAELNLYIKMHSASSIAC